MNVADRLQELAFDFYQRYILLERIEKLFRPREGGYRVLDVAGHTAAFWPGFPSIAGALIPDAGVTVVDVLPQAELRNYVRASGLRLPFRDGSFDLVCSLDTLEHVPAAERTDLISELLRVTRDGLYVAFPFDSAANRSAEKIVVQYAEAVLHDPIPALLEHRQFGLPERELVRQALAAHAVVEFEQGNTDIWQLMMLTYHTLRMPGTDFVQELNRRFNQTYANEDWAAPAYRTGFVASKRKCLAELEALKASFTGAGRAADVQGVLTMCRSFLSLAQSGRALVDKDRHIRNLEAQLKAAQIPPAPEEYKEPEAAPMPSFTAGTEVELECDYPPAEHVLPVRGVIEIRGWATAASGIERVLVQSGENIPVEASYGVPRDDAGACGFRLFWNTRGLPEDVYTLRIVALARSGQGKEIRRRVEVNRTTPMDYGLWMTRNEPSDEDKVRMRAEVERFAMHPTISIAVPVYRTPIPVLRKCIESVMAQLYGNWELCLADDCSDDAAVTALLADYAGRDPRVRTIALGRNLGISGATNAALKLATGDYVAFLDHDDELADFALWEVVRAIHEHPDTDLFYSDEDKLDERGRRYDAFFKPDWSPDLFRSCNYICHFLVMKRRLVERLGGLDETYSGSQDYEFLLRASEQTQKIRRIPKVLYHWRAMTGSTAQASGAKPKASEDGQRALATHLARTVPGGEAEEIAPSRYRVHYPIAENPRATILLPTAGNMDLLRPAVEDVLAKTTYKNYEILLIDHSRARCVAEYAESLEARTAPVRYLDWRNRAFHFSRLNAAARQTESPYILFLNDSLTVIAGEWMAAMLEHAQRAEVGAVGAELLYPNELIQHAGLLMGVSGIAGRAFHGLHAAHEHYFDFQNLIRNCSAVTAACLLISRAKFFEAGGFDESNLTVAYQDADLCLKLLELGYRNVYTPYAKLYCHEPMPRKDTIPRPVEDGYMEQRWAKYMADDPYYNPNLTRGNGDYRIRGRVRQGDGHVYESEGNQLRAEEPRVR